MPEPLAAPTDASARRGLVLAAVFVVTSLGAFMGSLDLSIVNIAFPSLQHTFASVPRSTLAWVITGYSIAFGSLLVVAGRTADRIGARRVFFTGLLVFCLGSSLCGLAPTVPLLIAGRVIQGGGAAAMLPSSLGLLLAAFPSERRTRIVSMWAGVGVLAVATGPTVGALLITAGGWRWVFFVNVPIGLVAWLLGRAVLRAAPQREAHPAPDYLGAALVSLTLASLVLALTKGPDWGWTGPRTLGCFAATVVLGALFIWRSARHLEPVLDLQLFKVRSFSVANTAMLLYSMGFFAMLLGNILFLTGVWHYRTLTAGLAVTPGPLVVAMVASSAGKLASRIGFRPVLVAGAACLVTGLALYATRVGLHPDYTAVWLPATLVTGLGIGLSFPVLGAAAVSSLHPNRYSVGSAVNRTARQVGGSIGVAVLVIVTGTEVSGVGALHAFEHLWWFAASAAVLSGLVCTQLRRPPVAATAPVDHSTVPARPAGPLAEHV